MLKNNMRQISPSDRTDDLKVEVSLIEAIKENNEKEVFALLNSKAEELVKKLIGEIDSKYGGGPLYWAADHGYTHFIDPLVKAGAEVNKPSHKGTTPVCIAAYRGHAKTIAVLYAAGANLDTPDKNGASPIFMAAQNGHPEVITMLHAGGANVDTPAKNGAAPVHIAAYRGHAAAIVVLHAADADVNKQNKDGRTPVFIASQNGHAEAIAALYSAGANVNTPDEDGITPVYAAAYSGHTEAIVALHVAGANVDTPDEDGATPVYAAAYSGHAEAIVALHAAGANMDTPDEDGVTPVYIASQNGHAEAITALHAGGANVNTPYDGTTPVYIAAKKGHAKTIDALYAAGADLNTPNLSRATPVYIYITVLFRYVSAISMLHTVAAKLNRGRNDTNTPLCAAAQKGHVAAVAVLLERGADASISTRHGTALEQAKQGKKSEHKVIIKLLEAHLKEYPNGIKPVRVMNSIVSLPTELSNSFEQKNSSEPAMLLQFQEFTRPSLQVKASDLTAFLKFVAEGEQDKAETLLKNNPALALVPGDVTDLSKRIFTNITGFQYAVWALDWHMWMMIRKYLPDDAAKEQASSFETGSWVKSYGVHADLNTLIEAYQTTIDLYNAKKYTEGNTAWVQQVGGAQLLLPVHMINEYCHPTRAFYPLLPNFKDGLTLPRSRTIDEDEWFAASYVSGKLGGEFAMHRGGHTSVSRQQRMESNVFGCSVDLSAVRALCSTRIAQGGELIAELNLNSFREKPCKATSKAAIA